MKLLSVTSGIIGFALVSLKLATAQNVTYSVIAFPENNESVAVSINNTDYPLSSSDMNANLFSGDAPYGADYRYTILTSGGSKPESVTRHLNGSVAITGFEFFNRSRTIWDIPELPKAYDSFYPPLHSAMNRSNEISTLLVNADSDALDKILKEPTEDHKYAQVFNMSFVSSDMIYNFNGVGIKNSGQSSKDYAKQSFKLKFNKFREGSQDKLFGREAFKLRAAATDPTMIREKLMMDSLYAAGATTLSGNYVRLYVNNEPYGLFLMIDDSYTGFTENFMNGGNPTNATGATYKGNAISDDKEANLVYKGDSNSSYNFDDVYILEDSGRDPSVTKKVYTAPLIDFMKRLNATTGGTAESNNGTIAELMEKPENTMVHMALNFLVGSWDGLWYQASNYYLTENTENKKWALTTYDFDETFGNDVENPYLIDTPYQNYSQPGSQRPLIDAIIKSPYYQPQFEAILRNIVQKFFNPKVLKPRVDAMAAMLKEDIAWDMSLPYRSPGDKRDFSLEDTTGNLYQTIGDRIGVMEWITNRTDAVAKQLNFTY